MFEYKKDGATIRLIGYLDASNARQLMTLLDSVEENTIIDLHELEYISSAGLAAFLETQKRLMEKQCGLTLRGMSKHIREIFSLTRFDQMFEIED